MAINVGRIDPMPMHPLGGFAQGFQKSFDRYMGPKIAQRIKDRRQDERDMADFNSMVIYEKEEAANAATKARESGDVNAETRAQSRLMELDELSKREDVTPSNARIYTRNAQAGIDSNMRISEGEAKSAAELEGLLEVQENRLGAKETAAGIRADLDKDLTKQKIDADKEIQRKRNENRLAVEALAVKNAGLLTEGNKLSRESMENLQAERKMKKELAAAEVVDGLESKYFSGDQRTYYEDNARDFVKLTNQAYEMRGLPDRVEMVHNEALGFDTYTYQYTEGPKKGTIVNPKAKKTKGAKYFNDDPNKVRIF